MSRLLLGRVDPTAFLSGTLRHLIQFAKLARAERSSTTTPWRVEIAPL